MLWLNLVLRGWAAICSLSFQASACQVGSVDSDIKDLKNWWSHGDSNPGFLRARQMCSQLALWPQYSEPVLVMLSSSQRGRIRLTAHLVLTTGFEPAMSVARAWLRNRCLQPFSQVSVLLVAGETGLEPVNLAASASKADVFSHFHHSPVNL